MTQSTWCGTITWALSITGSTTTLGWTTAPFAPIWPSITPLVNIARDTLWGVSRWIFFFTFTSITGNISQLESHTTCSKKIFRIDIKWIKRLPVTVSPFSPNTPSWSVTRCTLNHSAVFRFLMPATILWAIFTACPFSELNTASTSSWTFCPIWPWWPTGTVPCSSGIWLEFGSFCNFYFWCPFLGSGWFRGRSPCSYWSTRCYNYSSCCRWRFCHYRSQHTSSIRIHSVCWTFWGFLPRSFWFGFSPECSTMTFQSIARPESDSASVLTWSPFIPHSPTCWHLECPRPPTIMAAWFKTLELIAFATDGITLIWHSFVPKSMCPWHPNTFVRCNSAK